MRYRVNYSDLGGYGNAINPDRNRQAYVFAKDETEAAEKVKSGNRNFSIQKITPIPPHPGSLRETIEEDEMEIILDALQREVNRAKSIATRPIQGYGSASEYFKKEEWGKKAEKLELVINKLSESFI